MYNCRITIWNLQIGLVATTDKPTEKYTYVPTRIHELKPCLFGMFLSVLVVFGFLKTIIKVSV